MRLHTLRRAFMITLCMSDTLRSTFVLSMRGNMCSSALDMTCDWIALMLSKKRMYLFCAGSSVMYLSKMLHFFTAGRARLALGSNRESLAMFVLVADVNGERNTRRARS